MRRWCRARKLADHALQTVMPGRCGLTDNKPAGRLSRRVPCIVSTAIVIEVLPSGSPRDGASSQLLRSAGARPGSNSDPELCLILSGRAGSRLTSLVLHSRCRVGPWSDRHRRASVTETTLHLVASVARASCSGGDVVRNCRTGVAAAMAELSMAWELSLLVLLSLRLSSASHQNNHRSVSRGFLRPFLFSVGITLIP